MIVLANIPVKPCASWLPRTADPGSKPGPPVAACARSIRGSASFPMRRGDQPGAVSGQSPFAAEAVTQAVAGHRQGVRSPPHRSVRCRSRAARNPSSPGATAEPGHRATVARAGRFGRCVLFIDKHLFCVQLSRRRRLCVDGLRYRSLDSRLAAGDKRLIYRQAFQILEDADQKPGI